jgi:outer membrane protein TolC
MFMLLLGNSYAQTDTQETGWKLAPLQSLIDSALIHSPLMRSANVDIQLNELQLTDARRNWLRNLNVTADMRYGSMLDYSRLADLQGGMSPPSENLHMLNYGVGLSAYVPFSDIFDRKRQIQKAQIQVEQSKSKKTEQEQEVRQSVIDAYYEVLTAQSTLATRIEISSSASMLNDQSKLDYAEDRITLSDYTKTNDSYLNALNDVEVQKYALLKAVCKLEVIVGIQLIK